MLLNCVVSDLSPLKRVTRSTYFTRPGLGLGFGILVSSYYLNNGETDQEDRGDGSTPVPLDLGELAASDNNLTRVKLQAEDSPSSSSDVQTAEKELEKKTEEPFEIVEKADVEEKTDVEDQSESKTENPEEKPAEIDFSSFDNFECVSSTEVTSSSSLDATQKSSVDIPEDFDMFEGTHFH